MSVSLPQLHTRETWLKEGRVVRVGEQPYKMVKARPKRVSVILCCGHTCVDCVYVLTCTVRFCYVCNWQGQSVIEAHQVNTVEVFGHWQTELYIAPPVVNVSTAPHTLLLNFCS